MKNIILRPILPALTLVIVNITLLNMSYSSSALADAPIVTDATKSLHSHSQALTLEAALERTLKHNPALSRFKFRNQYLQAQKTQGQLRPALALDIALENVAGTQQYQGFDSAELTMALSSVIERGGQRRARGALSDTYLSQSQLHQQLKSLDVLANVTRLYIDTLAAQERVALAKRSLLFAQKNDATVRQRVDAGAAPSADASRAQSSALQAQLTVQAERQHLNTLKMALAAQWGSYKPDFNKLTGSLYQQPSAQAFEALFEHVKKSPNVQIYTAQARVNSAQLRLAEAESATNIGWSVGVKQWQDASSHNSQALTASVSRPLFSAKRNKASIAMIKANQAQDTVLQEQALLNFYNQLYRAYNSRQQALLTLKTLRDHIIPLLKQARQQTQQAYQKGRYSYLEYISSNTELIAAERAQIDSAAAALKYNTQIEQLTGQLQP
ncbi:TolC family protein [Marinagarivorans algicola]|uniref:TolC family protein n=1 Tax=Marinagarivorans algicola TaxID=1513270 RepID=UPI0009EB65C5|nr:TolC family protein [Marinagarivorans algicola]